MDGWIKLHRKIMENPDYFAEPFTRMGAWIDILLLANHSENYFYVRGNKVIVKRGQFALSDRTLAKRWRWSRMKAKRFLRDLETSTQISPQKSRILTVYTVLNYEQYQSNESTDRTTEKPQTGPQKILNKNDKNVKNNSLSNTREGLNEIFLEEGEVVKGPKKYGSLSDITAIDLQEIADKYHVPVPFVVSKFDDMKNWLESKGKKFKNYKSALSGWVKKDALKIVQDHQRSVSKYTVATI